MKRARRFGVAGAVCLSLLGLACEHSGPLVVPTTPTTPTAPAAPIPTPVPPSATFPSSLGGAYTLTIEFPTACAATSELSIPRRYAVRLSIPANYAYAGIYIAGGGYTEETVGGNLYPRSSGALLSWNNFDPVCDGVPEPLSGGRTLMVCGDGAAVLTETSIVGEIAGTVFVTQNGKRQEVCRGPHRLTFERVAP